MTGDEYGASVEALESGVCVLAVHGPVDLYGASDLRARLVKAVEDAAGGLVIDLTQTTFIDSSGLAVLVAAQRRARLLGCSVVVVNIDADIAHTLSITGLDGILTVVTDRADAVRRLAA